jgi:hypothetical protein
MGQVNTEINAETALAGIYGVLRGISYYFRISLVRSQVETSCEELMEN